MQHSKIAEPVQDPRLFTPTKVRVIQPFSVKGQRMEIGAQCEVPYHTAVDLRAIGKCELI